MPRHARAHVAALIPRLCHDELIGTALAWRKNPTAVNPSWGWWSGQDKALLVLPLHRFDSGATAIPVSQYQLIQYTFEHTFAGLKDS